MRRRNRAKSIALLVGIAIAVAPVIGINLLLWVHVNAYGNDQIQEAAQSILHQAEERIDGAMAALIGLGLRGVDGCGDHHREQIARAASATPWTQEISVTDGSGEVKCSSYGTPRVVRALSPRHDTLHRRISFDLVDHGISAAPRVVRLVWSNEDGSSVRALIPGSGLISPVVVGRMQSDFLARLALVDGTQISGRLTRADLAAAQTDPTGTFEAFATSSRYPVMVAITVPGAALWKTYGDLFIYSNVGGVILGAMVISGAWFAGRRFEGPERAIEDGLRRGEFIPYYQPVIDLRSGRLIGCEALVRWRHADGRIEAPGGFIGRAEASGLVFEMTRAVMRQARRDLEQLYAVRPGLKVSFNLIAGHFDTSDIVSDIGRIFDGSGIRPGQIVLEITERAPLPNMARARVVIAKLQDYGAQVALDDVGTGHGGLSYLLKLGVDQMKIDKMFIDAIGTDRYSATIIDSLVHLAGEMSMDLVAEGVETIEQAEYLREKGIFAAQGFLFAPALPAGSFLTLAESLAPAAAGADHAVPRALAG